jgi:hypothetical protein
MRGGAVPSSVSELPLTLGDARSGSSANATHVVLVQLAQLGLTRGQPADLAA